MEVAGREGSPLSWPEKVQIPSARVVYTALAPGVARSSSHASGAVPEVLFQSIELAEHHVEMLTARDLSPEGFMNWWRETWHSRDFCLETPDTLYRIHMTPRRPS